MIFIQNPREKRTGELIRVWALFPILSFSRPSKEIMQIYSDRFNMSSQADVRDGFLINLYWIMPFSITHSEPINSCTFPNAPASFKFQTLPTPLY